MRRIAHAVIAPLALLVTATAVSAQELKPNETASPSHQAEPASGLRLTRQATWLFRSYLRDEGAQADTLGLEFESVLGVGDYEVKNISYFEVAQYDRGIPGQPVGNPVPGVAPANGIGDLIAGFWLSRKGAHHGAHHFSLGVGAQFPTASADSLGAGKWSIGPSFDYEYKSDRLFAGAIAIQLWSFAGDAARKSVNMLMIKPFVYYSVSENWDLIYVPYGIQVYWNKPSGQQVYLPVGGGAQRRFKLGSTQMNLGAALYYNAIRPTNGTVWDLRLLVEFAF